MNRTASVILPAHDEAGHIGACLSALIASDPLPDGWHPEAVVIANGCRDDTADLARGHIADAQARGWPLRVLEQERGNKLAALNAGDAATKGDIRIYLDADVRVDPGLVRQLVLALDGPAPRYAGGIPRVAPAHSRITRAYARFWQRLPFLTRGVPGFGVFAMNAAGRRRWGAWPDIISDDTFARLHFAPDERTPVQAGYDWPMAEGFANLVRVRRRQNAGVSEIAEGYRHLLANDDKPALSTRALCGLALRDPAGFATYGAVAMAVKSPLFRSRDRWARGR